jgi:Ca2+-binding EF-hand superfamily protein
MTDNTISASSLLNNMPPYYDKGHSAFSSAIAKFDHNNGKVTVEEFFGYNYPDPNCDLKSFEDIDKDGNQKIDLNEWMMSGEENGFPRPIDAIKAFFAANENGDHVLSKGEYATYKYEECAPHGKTGLPDFEDVDLENNSENIIDGAEWLAAGEDQFGFETPYEAVQEFRKADTDGNNGIDFREYANWRAEKGDPILDGNGNPIKLAPKFEDFAGNDETIRGRKEITDLADELGMSPRQLYHAAMHVESDGKPGLNKDEFNTLMEKFGFVVPPEPGSKALDFNDFSSNGENATIHDLVKNADELGIEGSYGEVINEVIDLVLEFDENRDYKLNREEFSKLSEAITGIDLSQPPTFDEFAVDGLASKYEITSNATRFFGITEDQASEVYNTVNSPYTLDGRLNEEEFAHFMQLASQLGTSSF